jgi:hypothetical protein
MIKSIVTTTINKPTEATLKFCQISENDCWNFIIIGDKKTPHSEYLELQSKYKNVIYLTPEQQDEKYTELSEVIGWNTIQRRNIGFVEAYKLGSEIVATVDDDNIPYDDWGKNILVNKEVELDIYEPELNVFDPLSITKDNYVWHRGYPIEYLQKRHNVQYKGKTKRKILVQADLWDGDPDIDAMARLTLKPIVKYSDIQEPYCSNVISPFNSQNTFLSRDVIPVYCVFPFIGRMDDIWASYILQYHFPNSVAYSKATVYQDRNVQDLIKNLENEIIGYRNTLKLINDLSNFESYLPERTKDFYKIYKKQF